MAVIELNSTALINDANLQAYYRFESNFTDSGPNSYTLTNNNSATFSSGEFGNGANFAKASSQSATIAGASCTNLNIAGSQTWMCWVKLATKGFVQEAFAKYDGASGLVRFQINPTNTSGQDTVAFQILGLTTNAIVTSAGKLDTGIWYHLAGVYNSATTKLGIYINGVLDTEVTASGSANANTGEFDIGRLSSGGGEYLDGSIDDFAAFNRALTATEIFGVATGSSPSASISPSISPSASRSPSSSASPSISPSASVSPSASRSPSASVSPSISPSASRSPSSSISPSISPSASLSPSSSISRSISPSASLSPSPSVGFADYTRGHYGTLPLDDNDLITAYTEAEQKKTTHESNQDIDIEDDIGQTGALEYMVHQFKSFVGSNTQCTVELSAESTLSPVLSTVYLQIFNRSTAQWETLDSNHIHPANVTFELKKKLTSLTNYKNASNVIACRVYQLAI